ncbi:hypothetical protein D3C87_1035860 [compost metagenome]
MLDILVAWNAGLLLHRNGVDVLRLGVERLGHAIHPCVFDLLLNQESGAICTFGRQHALQGIQPFMRFLGIGVVGAARAENLLWYG